MATVEENVRAPSLDDTNIDYPEDVFVDGEPAPEVAEPDSTIFEKPKEAAVEAEKDSKKESKDGAEPIKTRILISGVVVAVIGAIFAIAKKIREA